MFPETVTVPPIVTSSLTVREEPELIVRDAPALTFNFSTIIGVSYLH